MLRRYNRFFCCACGSFAGNDEDGCEDVTAGPTNAKVSDFSSGKLQPSTGEARRLTWRQVEAITRSFTSEVVGEGGFSTVYLARLGSSAARLAAVKVHRSSERLHRAFRQELDTLLKVNHPHIVRLLAYCDEQEDGALVLEFMPNGNLHDKLHGDDQILPWPRRMVVALQVARALEYLHERCELQVVHGDVKASNVLLDASMDAKLCDFGSAGMGFSAAVLPRSAQTMLGSPGYIDPHYLRSGMITKKSDVYSFGVLLLELLTGKEAFCARRGRLLTAMVGTKIKLTGGDIKGVVDLRLGQECDMAEAQAVAEVAATCVGENPSLRPSMGEVVRIFEEKMGASISAVGQKSDGKIGKSVGPACREYKKVQL